MKRSFKTVLIFLIGLLAIQTTGLTAEDSEVILFTQITSGRETLYMTEAAGKNLRKIAAAKTISVFPEKRHLLYVIDRKLYEYDFKLNQTKQWAKFTEPAIQVSVQSDGPDQALIAGATEYAVNFYILDFSDGDLRKVSAPSVYKGWSSGRKLTVSSPDNTSTAIVQTGNGFQFQLSVETIDHRKWELSRSLSVLPDSPAWSPDSKKLAFYAKPSEKYDGFYSLYLLDLTRQDIQLRKIQDEVFSTYLFSRNSKGFRPCWSDNGSYLIFSYLPYGLPSESSIIAYHVDRGEKEILVNSKSQDLYPQLSADGEQLLFLSDRENNQFQLFLANLKLKEIKKISPDEGYTSWARWYRFRK